MKLIDYWPDVISDIKEFQCIAEVEQPEISEVQAIIESMGEEFSGFTLTEYGINRWEKVLKIDGKAADDLDTRRFRIITRIIEQAPITKRTLYVQLTTLCGADGFTLKIDHKEYTLEIKLALTSQYAFDDVKALVERSVPANLLCKVTVMYNSHSVLSRYTHSQLHGMTHKQLRTEVMA